MALRQFVQRHPGVIFLAVRPLRRVLGRQYRICRHAAAHDALDYRTKAEIDDLVCRHSNMYSRGKLGLFEFTDEERAVFKPVRQRLVRRHPGSARKSLFLSAHAGEIEGTAPPQARMLLLDLTEFATRERFVYSHPWQVGDLVMWDDRSTMHASRMAV